MSIMSRFVNVRNKYETAVNNRRTRKIKNLEGKEKVLKQEVKVEGLKAKKAQLKKNRKATKNFGRGVAKAISQGTKNDNAPYWLKQKSEKPYWLK